MMKKNNLILIGIIALLIIVLGFILLKPNSKVNLVNSEEFEKLINKENVFVIQAHAPYEEEINGTDLIAEDWEHMELYSDKLPQDKNAKILIYCKSGRMSAISAQQISKMGYKNVYDLQGGMNEWKNIGKEVISNN